jgi:predicted DNA-binding transcriptional regulator
MSAFKGIWIDAALLVDRRLTRNEMIVYAYMLSLGARFHASDLHMAKVLGLSHGSIRNIVAKLRKLGMVAGENMKRKPVAYTPPMSLGSDTGCHHPVTIDIRGEISREIREGVTNQLHSVCSLEEDSGLEENEAVPMSSDSDIDHLAAIREFQWQNAAR